MAVEFGLPLLGGQGKVGVDAGSHRGAEAAHATPARIAPEVFRQRLDFLTNLPHDSHGTLRLCESRRTPVGCKLLLCIGLQLLDLDDTGIRREPDIAEQPGDEKQHQRQHEKGRDPTGYPPSRRRVFRRRRKCSGTHGCRAHKKP